MKKSLKVLSFLFLMVVGITLVACNKTTAAPTATPTVAPSTVVTPTTVAPTTVAPTTEAPTSVVLSSITITTAPTKVSYVEGQSFDKAGMVVTANYSDGTSHVVTEYTLSKTVLAVSDTKVVVTYEGKTAELSITVVAKAVESIAITTNPTKVEYIEGQVFDPAGMVVTATYNDASTAVVTGYTCYSEAFAMGDENAAVTFEGKTANVAVTVVAKAVESIAITTNPTKVIYTVGESFDPAGMVVTATYNDASTAVVTDYTYDLGAFALEATSIDISFGGKTASVSVTINPLHVQSVALDVTEFTVMVGYVKTLTASVTPAAATNPAVTWSSSDEAVASVVDGKVTALAAGTATITCTTVDGEKTATLTITVSAYTAPKVIISEYGEGSSNNKWLELFNPTNAEITLSGVCLAQYNNGKTEATGLYILDLSNVTIEAYGTYVIANGSANETIKGLADVSYGYNVNNVVAFNGDDAIALQYGEAIVLDLVGVIGEDPGSSWKVGSGATADYTITRANGIIVGNTTFTEAEWVVNAKDYTDSIGVHTIVNSVTFKDTEGEVIDTKEYKAGEAILAIENPSKTGYAFAGWSGVVPAVMGTSAIEVSATWTANTYTLTFDYAGGNSADASKVVTYDAAIGAFPVATKAGYVFAGWKIGEEAVTAETVWNYLEGKTVVASWTAATDTAYTVEHYFEGLDGVFAINATLTEELVGTTEITVSAVAKTVEGFTHKADHPSALEEAKVKADGSLVLKVYYSRNSYTISFVVLDGVAKADETHKFGEALTITETTKVGYTFGGWTTTVPETMPASNLEFTAVWAAATDTAYTVEHWFEGLDGTYVKDTTLSGAKTGTTEATVNAVVETVAGFTHKADHADAVESGEIAAAGTLVLKVFYTRNSYTLSYDVAGGVSKADETYKFGQTLAATSATRVGYDFAGWAVAAPATMPADDVTLVATWTAATNTAYRVVYYFEDYEGGYIENPKASEAKVGTTGATVSAAVLDVAGFTHNAEHADAVESGEIAADGSLVLKAYYSRNSYTITFDEAGGSDVENITLKFDVAVTAPANPTRVGYEFAGWSPAVSAKMPVDGQACVAQWTAIEYAISYDLADGVVEGTNPVEYTIETETFALVNPTRTGYTFAGWTGTGLEIATISVSVVKGSTEAKSYVATWTINSYALTVSAEEGGSLDASSGVSGSKDYNASITVVAVADAGQNFLGWYVGEDQVSPNASYTFNMPAGDYAIVAHFDENAPAAYTVEHWFEGLDGEYVKDEDQTESKNGVIGLTVNAASKTVAGFTYKDDHASNVKSGVVVEGGSLVLKLYYSRNSYTITFDEAGGSDVENITLKFDVAVTAPANPTRVGYEFAGWSPAVSAKMPVDGQACVAQWTAIEYAISYDLAGGAVEGNPVKYTIETETITLVSPTREGYEFAGWTGTGLESATLSVSIAKGSTEAKSYVATWTAIEYAISYNLDGGVAEGNPVKYTIETDTFLLVSPTKTGYEFIGWTGTGLANSTRHLSIEEGSTGARAYTAVWSINQYKVSFDVNGGPVSILDINQDYGTAITAPADPSRAGYTFAGWSPAVPSTMPAQNTTCVAQWTINTYKLNVTAGAHGSIEGGNVVNREVEYLASYSVKAVPDAGYDFVGWYKGDLELSKTFTYSGTMDADDEIIEARFVAGSSNYMIYHYTESVNGESYELYATDSKSGTTDTYADAVILTNIAGFSHDSTIAGTYLRGIIAGDGSLELKVYYTRNEYTITFESNGGNAVEPITAKYGTAITLPNSETMTKTGHRFYNWYSTADFSTAFGGVTMPSKNTTLYAKWDVYKYTLIFLVNGGDGTGTGITQDYGTAVTAPADPTRVGYTFTGWSPVVPSTMPAENIYHTAQWTAKTYTLTFDYAGGSGADASKVVTYDAAIGAFPIATKAGYTFASWKIGDDVITAETIWKHAEDKTVVATWTPASGTAYTVEHYFEGVDGTYVIDASQTENLTGTTEAAVTATAKTVTGFTHNADHASAVESGNIIGDGSLVLKVYYTRNEYTITFNVNGGETMEAASVKYNSELDYTNKPVQDGFVFDGWYTDAALTQKVTLTIAEAMTVYAKWYTEEVATTTVGFETAEGFTTSSDYMNTTVNTDGNVGAQWNIMVGTVTTTDKISGSNSLQMRSYSSISVKGYASTLFGIDYLSKVVFSAVGKYSEDLMIVYFKANEIAEWTVLREASGKVLTTTVQEFIYYIPGAYTNVQIMIEHPNVNVSRTGRLTIDDITFYTRHLVSSEVAALINALPPVASMTLDDEPAVIYARKYYDLLTAAEKGEIVEAFATLENAEAKILALSDVDRTVTIVYGGETPNASVVVGHGDLFPRPATDPIRTGYIFLGWYAEAACTSEFNFTTAITADTSVYAKWVEIITVTAALDVTDGTLVAIEGTVDVINEGNFYIKDASNSIQIYGYNILINGTSTSITSANLDVNDVVLVYGTKTTYGTTKELTGSTLYSNDKPEYELTYSAGENGSVSAKVGDIAKASGDNIENGDSVVFTFAPTAGYRVASITVNSVVVDNAAGMTTYTTSITTTTTVAVTFEITPSYAVTYSVSDTSGTITSVMNGETAIVSGDTILAGTAITITVDPIDGYRLASYTIGEGSPVTTVAGETSFTLTINEATSFVVAFEVIPAETVLVASYDFTGTANAAKLGTSEITTSTIASNTVTTIRENFVDGSGTNIIESLSSYTKAWQGYVNSSKYGDLGMKFGTSSVAGTITFGLTEGSNVTKVVVVVAGWTATDTVTINGLPTQIPGVAYSADNCLKTLTFELTSASDSITITFAKRGFLQQISFYAPGSE